MDDLIRPHVFVALRLPSGLHKITQLKPDTTVALGKYGTFNTQDLLGRPFYATYEIIDNPDATNGKKLRIVSASELYEQDELPEAKVNGDQADGEDREHGPRLDRGNFEILDESGQVLMRTNRNILDNNAAQKLTMAEIEELKQVESASGRDIIAKIMESHSSLDKKTAFSLAKYTTRKANKYLRRFVPVPVDVPFLAKWWLHEKEAAKVMDMREELLALVGSWSNVHFTDPAMSLDTEHPGIGTGRWLVVDETGGLMVASVAEKLGILYQVESAPNHVENQESSDSANGALPSASSGAEPPQPHDQQGLRPVAAAVLAQESHMSAKDNSITLIHSNAQPNLALLSYFGYDYTTSTPSHPLHRHLKSLSWLQLIHPEEDPTYEEPEVVPKETLDTWKSAKRGGYYRKRRRWERIKGVIDQTREGGFDGLLVASAMAPVGILHRLVPLLRGGAQVAVYSANIEPLAELVDYYSISRKTAFLAEGLQDTDVPTEDFPVNPNILLSPTVYTARARPWQVLPGRTHPMMTGLGGPEGYVFTGTRVSPIEGEKVEGRGSFKRRKTAKQQDPS